MRTKFIHLIALIAVIFSVGSLASCKDYSEDDYNELKIEQGSLVQTLQNQITVLQTQLTTLQNALAAINSCKCDTSKYVTHAELNDSINAAHVWTNAQINAAKTELQTQIDSLQARIQAVESFLDVDGYNLSDVISLISTAQATADGAVAAAANALSAAQAAQSTANQAVSDAAAAQASANAAKDSALIAQAAAALAQATADAANAAAAAAQLKADSAAAQATANSLRIDALVSRVDTIYFRAWQAYILARKDSAVIAYYNTRIDSLGNVLDIVRDSLPVISQAIVDSVANVRVEIAQTLVEAKTYADEQHAAALARIQETSDSLASAFDLKIDDVKEAMAYADSLMADQIDTLSAHVEVVVNRLDSAEARISQAEIQILGLQNSLAGLVSGVIVEATHNPVIGSLLTPFGIQTNILVAYHGKFVGNSKGSALKFPTSDATYYLNAEDALTAADMAMLGITPATLADAAGQNLISDEEGNAGVVYLTVNPVNVDFAGKVTPTLVNTQGVVSGVKLGALETSDKTLMFGYTRAAGNGFYAAKATVSEDDLANVQRVDINKSGLKSTLKDILNSAKSVEIDRNGISYTKPVDLTKIATTVYNSVNDILDANGVQVSYTDDNGISRTIVSKHDVAATVVNPLSYKFGSTFDYETVPGYDQVLSFIKRANSYLNRVVNDIRLDVNVNGMHVNLDLSHISMDTLSYDIAYDFVTTVTNENGIQTINANGDTVTWTYTYDMQGLLNGLHGVGLYYNDIIDVVISYDATTIEDITIDGSQLILSFTADYSQEVLNMIKQINNAIGSVDDIKDDLQSFLDDINDYLANIGKIDDAFDQVTSVVDKATDYLIRALDFVNNKIVGFVNSINDRLQPVLIGRTANGNGVLFSGVKAKPTPVASSFTMCPTSYTAELVAPAFKKFVAVTNVFANGQDAHSSADCKAKLQAANNGNAGLNTVLDGTVRYIDVQGLQAGYVYEIVYSAVDFSGVIVADKYYVTVK